MNIESLKQELKEINKEYSKIRDIPSEERKAFGEKINAKKQSILKQIEEAEDAIAATKIEPIDITAPCAPNKSIPGFKQGSKHPLMTELDTVVDIYQRMGFAVLEPRQLDDEYHMFDSLNFSKGHPARDGYDTFRTSENFIPIAHTSAMQNRALRKYKGNLEKGEKIAVCIPGRVFRNEDIDPTHEHTFYQCEGVYVSSDANMGQLLGIFKNFFETYYGQSLHIKTQPGYFPFTEPSFELLVEKPAGLGGKGDGWLELLGCGMIHPNVLKSAGIDSDKYKGFAWGGGIDRLVMMKYALDDVRHFESGKLDFLEEF